VSHDRSARALRVSAWSDKPSAAGLVPCLDGAGCPPGTRDCGVRPVSGVVMPLLARSLFCMSLLQNRASAPTPKRIGLCYVHAASVTIFRIEED
jgi:hypothetical protein